MSSKGGKNKIKCLLIASFAFVVIFSSIHPSLAEEHVSPKKQLELGILPLSISCKEDFELVIKFNNNFPACVNLSTSVKLLDRGWGSTLENLDVGQYDSPIDYPYGLYSATMPLRHPNFQSLSSTYGTLHNNPDSFHVTSLGFYDASDISSMILPPTFVPEGQDLKLVFSEYREETDSNLLTFIYIPQEIEINENTDTLIDVWDHNGILILITTNLLPENQDLDLWRTLLAEQNDMEFVTVGNIDALMSKERDPFKGERSEIRFFHNETQIQVISLAYSGLELHQIAQSMFE